MSKPKSNGFTSFCWEWKSEKEKEGYHFSNIREVMGNEDCYNTWKNSSEEFKDYYRLLAKCSDFQVEGGETKMSSSRFSYYNKESRHSPHSTYHSRRNSKASSCKPSTLTDHKKMRFTMVEYITLLKGLNKSSIFVKDFNFYVGHANYFYFREGTNGERDYYPVELAIAECSLEKGVQRVHHVIIKEEIVKGYRCDAVTRSQESYKIPIDFNLGKVEVETDYVEIFQGICKFMEPGSYNSELPPLFTLKSNDEYVWKPINSILGRLAIADNKPSDHITLYSFEELFAYIHNAAVRNERRNFDMIEAIEKLERDPNAHRNGFGCEYHKRVREGELHCSTSFVKRWFYKLCDCCCEPLGIAKIPGLHEPADSQQPSLVLTKLNSRFHPRESRDHRRYFKY